MINLIIDSDIGADCDDVVALSLACALERRGKVRVKAISACTTRKGAACVIRAVIAKYGLNPEVCQYKGEPIACDKMDNYAHDFLQRYALNDHAPESVATLRKAIYQSAEKVTFVELGPMTVLARLLASEADEVCPYSGVELFERKVEKVYLMAGNFTRYHNRYGSEFPDWAEWNVLQDIEAAHYVAEHCPVQKLYLPSEVGVKVMTGSLFDEDTPEHFSIKCFYSHNPDCFPGQYARSSWDPITVLLAGEESDCEHSPEGKITVDEEGKTYFEEGKGKDVYFLSCAQSEKYGELIDQITKE